MVDQYMKVKQLEVQIKSREHVDVEVRHNEIFSKFWDVIIKLFLIMKQKGKD